MSKLTLNQILNMDFLICLKDSQKISDDIYRLLKQSDLKEQKIVLDFCCDHFQELHDLKLLDCPVVSSMMTLSMNLVFEKFLKVSKYRNLFIKYSGYEISTKYLNEEIPISILTIRSFMKSSISNYTLQKHSYKSVIQNVFMDFKQYMSLLGDYSAKYEMIRMKGNYSLHTLFIDNSNFYLQYVILYVLYHEFGHAIQLREYKTHFDYSVYRMFKEDVLLDFDYQYYFHNHDFFEKEIDADIKAVDMFEQSIYHNDSYLQKQFQSLQNQKALNRATIRYQEVDDQVTNIIKNHPNILASKNYPLLCLEYEVSGKQKDLLTLIQHKILSIENDLGDSYVDYEDLYNHLIVNQVLKCEPNYFVDRNFPKYVLSELLVAIDYMKTIYLMDREKLDMYYQDNSYIDYLKNRNFLDERWNNLLCKEEEINDCYQISRTKKR